MRLTPLSLVLCAVSLGCAAPARFKPGPPSEDGVLEREAEQRHARARALLDARPRELVQAVPMLLSACADGAKASCDLLNAGFTPPRRIKAAPGAFWKYALEAGVAPFTVRFVIEPDGSVSHGRFLTASAPVSQEMARLYFEQTFEPARFEGEAFSYETTLTDRPSAPMSPARAR
jgi:hypothetical protein